MIYLQNKTSVQSLIIPNSIGASLPVSETRMDFKAKSTIDLAVEVNESVRIMRTSSQYFDITIALPAGLTNGEYEYFLMYGGVIFSSGLLVIGENSKPSEYKKEIEYEQYETEN